VSKYLRFRRRNRPGWGTTTRMRLKGLAQAVRPSFVRRLEQMRQQRKLRVRAAVVGAVLIGLAAVSWALRW
jgi:hypothetical protein